MLQDLRFAFRQIRKSPGFAFVAVLTLALGIGANTGIFTLLDQTLLRKLPVWQPDELVRLRTVGFHEVVAVAAALPARRAASIEPLEALRTE
jgi:ABC-type antimicrobial peptide transport system permease subunit